MPQPFWWPRHPWMNFHLPPLSLIRQPQSSDTERGCSKDNGFVGRLLPATSSLITTPWAPG